MSEHPWLSTGVVIVAVSTLLVAWARTRPSYDAYGWIVWGYQTLHGSLDLGGAPSWKPLPFLFTVPFALFGHYQLWLWMITACLRSRWPARCSGPDRVPVVRWSASSRDELMPLRRFAVGTRPRSSPEPPCSGSRITSTTS